MHLRPRRDAIRLLEVHSMCRCYYLHPPALCSEAFGSRCPCLSSSSFAHTHPIALPNCAIFSAQYVRSSPSFDYLCGVEAPSQRCIPPLASFSLSGYSPQLLAKGQTAYRTRFLTRGPVSQKAPSVPNGKTVSQSPARISSAGNNMS
jgi:hypothetical protein